MWFSPPSAKHNGILANWEGRKTREGFEYHIRGIGIALVILIYDISAFSLDRLLLKIK